MSAPDRDALLELVHDLNNALCVISGELQLIESALDTSPELRESLASMRLALARGAELARELARMSKSL